MPTLTIYHGAPNPIRVRGEHVCNLVGFAQKYPGWHSLGKDRKDRRALESAKRAGCIETNEFGQFRFTYPKDDGMKITTNNVPRPLFMAIDLPAKIIESEFDYIEDDCFTARFFRYRDAWYDAHEFVCIRSRADAVGFEHGVDADSPLRTWEAIKNDSYFSAIVIRLADDDRVIVGRAYS